jgi:hypothetical protein
MPLDVLIIPFLAMMAWLVLLTLAIHLLDVFILSLTAMTTMFVLWTLAATSLDVFIIRRAAMTQMLVPTILVIRLQVESCCYKAN